MKFLCDVHIPYRLVKWLEQQGMEALHVNRLPDKWHTTDQDICQYADKHDCIVISKDADFRATYFVRKTPRKLIRIELGNLSNAQLLALFTQHLDLIQDYFTRQTGYLELGNEGVTLYPAAHDSEEHIP
ncbi:Uncharacterised protein [Candidatus Venteria ishoeyi]|uniref:DUF5615 domain-containing protein n=2 Tax=Candidatus Venteria ishoeyi TaxID=1899563 RepID=A0A1H6F9I0_9GAMM|nr:Uncharacterised protein [Candidatus Venteria ishoeyi]